VSFKALFAKITMFLIAGFFVCSFLTGFVVDQYFKSFANKSLSIKEEVVVEIPYGSSLRQVSRILAPALMIPEKKFYWYLRLGRLDGQKMQAGFYSFLGSNTHAQIATRLLFGVDQAFKLVFKEGESLRELSQKLVALGLVTEPDFIEALKSPAVLDASFTAPAKNLSGGLEGYLFPDTYFFSKKDNALSIIKKMHGRLRSKLANDLERIKEGKFSLHEVLTLASIVEKETADVSERPLIASVYLNRLKLGMRLQADPTVIYGIEGYDGKIRKKDLTKSHPYNTYVIKGLPPGPIAAPGIEAIRAVLWPKASNYLYFVSKNDGTHIFCEDLSCHNRAVRIWQINYFKKQAKK
jgi:UPF0755 protein